MPTTVSLYYPFIHFRDDAWLKLAALYWDGIGRIVPEGYNTRDSDTVKRLADELDFVHNFTPGPEAEMVGKRFGALLQLHHSALVQRYDVNEREHWAVDPQTLRRAPQRDPRLVYINNAKLSWELASNLQELRLGVVIYDFGDWIGMHPRLASVYMAALAEEMARRRRLSPVTDDDRCHLAAAGWTIERLAAVLLEDPALAPTTASAAEVEGGLANIALTAVVPAHLEAVSVEDIIKARTKLHEDRLAFQESLREIAADEAWLQDVAPDALEWQLKFVYKNRLKPILDRYEKSLTLAAVPARRGIISLLTTLPRAALEAAKAVGWTTNPLLGAAVTGASLVLIPILTPKSKAKKVEDDASPVGYLLRLREELEPKTVSERLVDGAKLVTAQALATMGTQGPK